MRTGKPKFLALVDELKIAASLQWECANFMTTDSGLWVGSKMTNEPVHSRVDLACEQLDVAIDLFFAMKSDVSALTLAGAAEEILGIELKNRDKASTLSAKYKVICRLLEQRKRHIPTWHQFTEEENYARNAAKHIADKSRKDCEYDPFLRGDLRRAATYMLLRAANNVRMLGYPRSEQVQIFEGWYLAQEVNLWEPET